MDASGEWEVLSATLWLPAPNPIERPTLAQVLNLFERVGTLTGGDLAVTGTLGKRVMMVGGGPTDLLVSCAGDDYGAYNLVDPAACDREGWVTLMTAGISTPVPLSTVVGRDLAQQAVEYFFAHGTIDPHLEWQ